MVRTVAAESYLQFMHIRALLVKMCKEFGWVVPLIRLDLSEITLAR